MDHSYVRTSYLIVITMIIYIVVIPLFMQGMFMDGQQYGVVAMNFADNKGTFWHPFLSDTWAYFGENSFLEHPPLGYHIQSLSFKVFGHSYLSERVFNLVLFIITILTFSYLWKYTLSIINENLSQTAWLPLILFILIETCSWAFINNVLETQMALFDLLAVIIMLKAFYALSRVHLVLYSIIAGMLIALAVLIKGVPGLFPLAVPLGFFFLEARKRNLVIPLISLFSLVLVLTIIYFGSEDAKSALDFYINKRLLLRIDGGATVNSRFHIFIDLISQLIPILILSGIALLVTRKQIKIDKQRKNYVLFFLFVGLAASAPLALTKVQRGFYLYPSYFYYVIAFALLTQNSWVVITKRIKPKVLKPLRLGLVTLSLIGIGLTFYLSGKPSRDGQLLKELSLLILPYLIIQESTTMSRETQIE
jgi:4-amino-4-deoxy-L-arabinose transferase-like glycosyltransferase